MGAFYKSTDDGFKDSWQKASADQADDGLDPEGIGYGYLSGPAGDIAVGEWRRGLCFRSPLCSLLLSGEGQFRSTLCSRFRC